MTQLEVSQKVQRRALSAVITRANGRVEDLGVISYWHINPLRRWGYALAKRLRLRISP